jgi:hypothetical protein
MTDQEHADEINQAVADLNKAIRGASSNGLGVSVSAFVYTPMFFPCCDFVRVEITRTI